MASSVPCQLGPVHAHRLLSLLERCGVLASAACRRSVALREFRYRKSERTSLATSGPRQLRRRGSTSAAGGASSGSWPLPAPPCPKQHADGAAGNPQAWPGSLDAGRWVAARSQSTEHMAAGVHAARSPTQRTACQSAHQTLESSRSRVTSPSRSSMPVDLHDRPEVSFDVEQVHPGRISFTRLSPPCPRVAEPATVE